VSGTEWLVLPGAFGFGVDERCDGRIAAQPVQAAAADRPDAADWDIRRGADFGVRDGRVLDELGNQPLAARGEVQECLAECRVALCRKQGTAARGDGKTLARVPQLTGFLVRVPS